MACVPGNTKPIGSHRTVSRLAVARPCLTVFREEKPNDLQITGNTGEKHQNNFSN